MKVMLGHYDKTLTGSRQQGITLMSEKIILHEQYNDCTAQNDIGLIKLSGDAMSARGKLKCFLTLEYDNIFSLINTI